MKYKLVLFICILHASSFVAQINFSLASGSPFEGVQKGSIAFADIDGDNDQDVLITGQNLSNVNIANLYTNNGSGTFTLVSGTPFEGVFESAVAFADVDGDNDQDVLIAGINSGGASAKLYTNNGSGNFSLMSGTPFVGAYTSSIAFGDVDGDNDMDVIIAGLSPLGNSANLYTNNGSGTFSLVGGAPFEGVTYAEVAMADIDGDNDKDVLITGGNSMASANTYLYSNNGSGAFTLVTGTSLVDVRKASIAFADIDGDNDKDLLIAGEDINFSNVSKLYTNNGSGTYTLVNGTPFLGVALGCLAFADVDSDNDLDVLITGSVSTTNLYCNNGSGLFTLQNGTPFEGVFASSIAFADVDNDNDKDVLITGLNSSNQPISNLYINNTPSATSSTQNITACFNYTSPSGNYTWTTSGTYLDTIPNTVGNDSIITINLTINSILDQAINISQNVFCDSAATTVNMASSELGINYYLQNDANDSVYAGPIAGTGSALGFSTGNVSSTTTFKVTALNITDKGLTFNESNLERAEIATPFTAYTNAMTVEAWVYFPSSSGSFPWMGQSGNNIDNMSTNVWLWHSSGSGNNFTFFVNDNANWFWVNSVGLTGVTGWHHIATVADNSGLKIYVDGVLDATSGGISTININPISVVHIGGAPRQTSNASHHGTFSISEFRLWNTARSISEINDNIGYCLLGNEQGLKMYHKFDDGIGTIATATTGANATLSAGMNPSTAWITGVGNCPPSCALVMTQRVTLTVNNSTSSTQNISACNNYNWNNNTYTSSGTYMDTIVNAVGCDSIMTLNLTINSFPVATTNTNSETITATQMGATYQWIDCDNANQAIAGETNQSYTASANGNYAVIVNDNGCSDTSACVNINSVGIIQISNNESSISVWPNPTNGTLNINFTTVTKISNRVKIIGILGNEVYNKVVTGNTQIDLSGIDAGTYFLIIETNDKPVVQRISKQ